MYLIHNMYDEIIMRIQRDLVQMIVTGSVVRFPTNLLLEVGWENEPLKNRDFNFESHFLSQQNFWWQKLDRIGISHA